MSTLKLTTLSNLAGTASVPSETVISGSAKAWVNFNGGGTLAIRASFNVSSMTDNGVGKYTANLIDPMVDANYAILATNEENGTEIHSSQDGAGADQTTTAVKVWCVLSGTGTSYDPQVISVVIFR